MIKGIGTDILEISRMNKVVNNNKFMSTYYTVNEILYINGQANMAETATAMFCAKEAAAKAIGTGFRGFYPKDIEILHGENSRPYILLGERALKAAERVSIKRFNVSMSHCREYAVAYVIAEGDESI